eukprot:scaffold6661_cov109-Cylindrotheca_fusiformis.AAC.8
MAAGTSPQDPGEFDSGIHNVAKPAAEWLITILIVARRWDHTNELKQPKLKTQTLKLLIREGIGS